MKKRLFTMLLDSNTSTILYVCALSTHPHIHTFYRMSAIIEAGFSK